MNLLIENAYLWKPYLFGFVIFFFFPDQQLIAFFFYSGF
uniref:Uncharacterized protein n=1 Tax=Rhizophora mucronata TaxID=61149 RepID=A0A2P2PXG7_RHIMU